ncbi:TonB-dependent receptor [Labilibacter sediminis]|nr:TonB-dependent receptor [Labilibacter sediminis]
MIKSFCLRKVILLLTGLLFITGHLSAQEMTITGSVTDASNNDPLPGVTVAIMNTTSGTITMPDGVYNLKANKGDVLIYSFIGFLSQQITVADQETINVQLEPDVIGMDEVVVIGYGTSKKKDLTGSVQTVSAKDFNQGAINSPQQLLNGKVAGVQITDGGGAPGAKSTIKIRGGSSLTASNDPLIIIDGVPIDNDDVSGMRNPLNVVNPNDIETFTVLKDASATAIYGSRASNGVILITTKKGTKSGLQLDYAGNVSVSTPTKKVDVLSPTEFRSVMEDKFPANTNLMGDASTDWQDEIYRNAVSTDHNVAMSGTITDNLPFRASVGYNNANGILDESNMTRTTAALNLNPSLFDDHLRINIAAKGMYIKNNFSNEDAVGSAIGIDPTQVIKGDGYDDFGGYFAWTRAGGNPNGNAPDNPIAQINQRIDRSIVNRFVGNAQFDYKFHFLPELRANLNIGIDALEGKDDGTNINFSDYGITNPLAINKGGKQTLPGSAWDTDAYLRGGTYENYNQKKENKLLDFYLQYTKNLGSINSRFDVMGGYSWQHFYGEKETGNWFNLPNEEGEYFRDAEKLEKNENYLVSFFGRLNYVLAEKYYLTFTLRNDGSSRFAEENRWGLFPSVALAWNMKDESFLSNSGALSTLKMKLGYGVTGQQNIGDDYGYFGTYKSGLSTAQYLYYNPNSGNYDRVPITTIRPNGYDENLKWEETTTYNLGFDYGFLNNRISGSLDVYLRETKDLLNEIPVPAGANLTNELTTNVGNLENKGFEFSVNAIAIDNGNFNWNVGANITYNKNEITKLTQVDDPNYIGVLDGGISGGTGNKIQVHQVGYPASSFFVYKQIYDTNGVPIEGLYEDKNGDGEFNESDLYVGENSNPTVMIGLNTSLSYKDWDFSMAGRANLGMHVYNNMASSSGFYDNMQVNGEYLRNINKDVYNTQFKSSQYFSDYYVQNASFFRLDNVTVGHNLSEFLGTKLNMRVYGSVNNVFVITDYEGVDPEVDNGIDNNIYPRPRTYLLGVTVTF